jgi:hypothetical protein
VNSSVLMRGKLLLSAASLVLFLSGEILKWQFPATAAAEKLASLANLLRAYFFRPIPQIVHR